MITVNIEKSDDIILISLESEVLHCTSGHEKSFLKDMCSCHNMSTGSCNDHYSLLSPPVYRKEV